jgi:hypothetical protein
LKRPPIHACWISIFRPHENLFQSASINSCGRSKAFIRSFIMPSKPSYRPVPQPDLNITAVEDHPSKSGAASGDRPRSDVRRVTEDVMPRVPWTRGVKARFPWTGSGALLLVVCRTYPVAVLHSLLCVCWECSSMVLFPCFKANSARRKEISRQ